MKTAQRFSMWGAVALVVALARCAGLPPAAAATQCTNILASTGGGVVQAAGTVSATNGTPTANYTPDYTYTTNADNTLTLTRYTGSGGAVTIPDTIDSLPVTSIGTNAFDLCEGLTSVTVPASVTNIGDWAFNWCYSLTSVYCQGKPPSLGGPNVFNSDNATVYYLPVNAASWSPTFGDLPTAIWPHVLLTLMTNPGGTVTGGGTYWAGTNVQLVASASNGWWFQGWSDGTTKNPYNLTVPNADCTNTAYFGNAPLQCSYTIAAGEVTITGYTGPGGALTFPSTIMGLPVTSIGDYAFEYTSNLTSVTISDSITSIGYQAFAWCQGLTAITADPSNSVFSSVAGVLFDKSSTTLLQCPNALAGTYTIPDGVTNIADNAFNDCYRLTSVMFPAGVTSLGNAAFEYCGNLTSITLPATITSIGNQAFAWCHGLTAITVDPSNSVYSSVAGVLFDKSQTVLVQYPGGVAGSYSIPNGVTNIADHAFEGCGDLSSVMIPASLTSIGQYAFASCYNLTSVFCAGNAPGLVLGYWGESPFVYGGNATVYYLPGSTDWTNPWGDLTTVLSHQAPLTVTANPVQGGTVTGGGTYWAGTNVQLVAAASNGWVFTGWNNGVTKNPYSITVPLTNITYTANFRQIDSVGDGLSDLWRSKYFGGNGTTTNALSCAAADPDGDGLTNLQEFLAGTNPNDASSGLRMLMSPSASPSNAALVVQWQSVAGKFYILERSTNLVSGFDATIQTHIPATPPVNSETDTSAVGKGPWFYRVRLE